MGVLYYILGAVSTLFLGSIGIQLLVPVKKQSYAGQHVVVTGGSQGMGKAVAREFVARGADVTIIARTQATLDEAVIELKETAAAKQTVQAVSLDCTDADAVVAAFARLSPPDVLFCCAGTKNSW